MKKRRLIGNIAVVAFAVVACVLALELFLHLDNPRPPVDTSKFELNGEPYSFLETIEAFDAIGNSVVFIGDSFTLGHACGPNRNYPNAFENTARENNFSIGSINMGIPGTDVFGYLNVVEDLLASDKIPAAAIITLYSNDMDYGDTCAVCKYLEDISMNGELSEEQTRELSSFCSKCKKFGKTRSAGVSFVRRIHTWLVIHSYSYSLFREGFAKLSLRLGLNIGWGRTAFPSQWKDHEGKSFQLLVFALARVRSMFEGTNTPMMIVIYPDVSEMREDNIYVEIYDAAAKRLSDSLGIPVYSGYEAFLGKNGVNKGLTLSLTDSHPSCEAHQIFGTWVFNKFRNAFAHF